MENGLNNLDVYDYVTVLNPVTLDISYKWPGEEYSYTENFGTREYSCYEDFGFSSVIDSSETRSNRKLIWESENFSQLANKVKFELINKKLNTLTIYQIDGEIRKFVKNSRFWCELNGITLNISYKSGCDEIFEVHNSANTLGYFDKLRTKIKCENLSSKYFNTLNDNFFDKIVMYIGDLGIKKLIFKSNNFSECAKQVSICSSNGDKYLSILHKNYNYSLLKYTNDIEKWVDITESRMNLSKLKFYNGEKYLSIKDLKIKYEIYLYEMNYCVVFQDKDVDFDVIDYFLYNLIENSLKIFYRSGISVTHDPNKNILNLYNNSLVFNNSIYNIDNSPENSAVTVENLDKPNEIIDKFDDGIILNINGYVNKKYVEYICTRNNKFKQISVENHVIWSSSDPNEYVEKVSYYNGIDKYLMIFLYNNKHLLYYCQGNSESWTDITYKRVDLKKIYLINEDGKRLTRRDYDCWISNFQCEIKPKKEVKKIEINKLNLLYLNGYYDEVIELIAINFIYDELIIVLRNGKIIAFSISNHKVKLIQHD
ncbi:subtelomeric sfi-fragment-related protein family member, putative [Theileria annulata]|uniref:Subtelomeric sfi-fragment-related protein family member, putative n=1 Tax=Theileria annulata TaxID=5874 RepID=Q4UD97_THEAN|nr:subtelomeric sfi-fragment-related protein family member, putative [Theileria annulata]CAI74942.1 subtelomeric sfi-fragment-related protein family member, putative [Theileria annulata]